MKTITLAGRLTKDAETRDAGSDRVTGFSVAVDDRSGKEKTTLFFDCSMWGKRGEALAQYLTKGSSVTVSGDLGTRQYEGKTYLTVRVNDVTLQGGKPASDEGFRGSGDEGVSRGGGGGDHSQSGRGDRRETYDLSDDIPFARPARDGEV
jgi:single-strand DNA-binding protein